MGGFSGYQIKTLDVVVNDPGQDRRITLLKVPAQHSYSIQAFEIALDRDLSAGAGTGLFGQLENAGTSGTAQTAISGSAGGTAGFSANVAQAATITAGSEKLTAGQYLNMKYDEEGTIAPGNITVHVEYVDGVD